jgi:hypothetical protein
MFQALEAGELKYGEGRQGSLLRSRGDWGGVFCVI